MKLGHSSNNRDAGDGGVSPWEKTKIVTLIKKRTPANKLKQLVNGKCWPYIQKESPSYEHSVLIRRGMDRYSYRKD